MLISLMLAKTLHGGNQVTSLLRRERSNHWTRALARLRALACAGTILAFSFSATPSAHAATHPLDPLDFAEHWQVLEILRSAERLDKDTRFSRLRLHEPAKRDVLRWQEGEPIPRRAYALLRQGKASFEAIVDLQAGEVASWTELEDVQPNWQGSEYGAVVKEVLEHPAFLAGLEKRGITDTLFLDCATIPPGYYGTEEQCGRRVGHVRCKDARGTRNTWSREIPGLTAVVDLDANTVLRVVDEGKTPVAMTDAGYRPAVADQAERQRKSQRPAPGDMRIEQPLGPGFEIDGYRVAWGNWRFHVRPDPRAGTVVALVRYHDAEVGERSVLYEGHLSEIFVPYMDPSFAWYARNFIDAGEFSAGGLIEPLLRGRDCPDHAVYFDAVGAGANGRPNTKPRVVCLFERQVGDPLWRHWSGELPQSRASRDLVVRSAMVIGNYDYLLDWIFRQDGSIRVAVGATGIVEAKAVRPATAASRGGKDAAAYGRFVAERLVAVNHDHYFNFRLDLDIDGVDNSLVLDRLETQMLPADHPRRSIWVPASHTAKTEADAKLDIDLRRPTLWRVTGGRKNHVGYAASYHLAPGRNAATLLSADDYPRRRTGFIDHHLWVTPHRKDERWAAGDHPTLSEPGMGLPTWTAADRKIRNTDIVLWHTVGMHHLPRAEDWPVMPVMWHSFDLRPFDFFDSNPALDLP